MGLSWPENLIPIFQPAHSPQLNPIERLWQFIKRQFKGKVSLIYKNCANEFYMS
ncbi:transposase [Nostoc sp. DSM 114159]